MCFSDEEVITVGSSAYNLAGDVESRGNFMKNTILSSIFSGASKDGLGKNIVDSHLAGPATSYVRFFKWAETSGYNAQVGNLGGLVYNPRTMSLAAFRFLVPVKSRPIVPTPTIAPFTEDTHDQRVIAFSTGAVDLHLIALEWIINFFPANRNKVFKATLGTFGNNILISYETGGTSTFTTGYNLNNKMPFLYLYHEERLKLSQIVTNTNWVVLPFPETPPSRSTYVNGTITVVEAGITVFAAVVASGSPVIVSQAVPATRTTIVIKQYSDGRSTTSNTTSAVLNLNFNKIKGKYTKIITVSATPVVKGKITTEVQDEESFYNILYAANTSTISEDVTTGEDVTTFEDVVTPVLDANGDPVLDANGDPETTIERVYTTTTVYTTFTVTTQTTVITPYLQVYWGYQKVITIVTQQKWLPYFLKIYQKGSSVTGDALLFNAPTAVQKFFPVIPLRRDNIMVDLAHFPTQYDWNRKASKRCFGSKKKYDSLIKSLKDNPNLADIDHAWVVFGVSLSTKQQEGQKYLYAFFKNLADTTISAIGTYKSPSAYSNAWATFISAVALSPNDETGGNVIYRPTPPLAQEYAITVNSSSGLQDWLYNTTITAKGGSQVVGSGYHVKALGKVGHCWVYAKSSVTINIPRYINDGSPEGGNMILSYVPESATVIAFGKQVTEETWVEYEFFDLVHTNNVYAGITTTTLATTVIADPKENSSFIIPLHEAVFSDLTLVRRTQFSLECAFIVVNYYDKQYIPWYASGFFQIIIVIIIIVVAVYTGYIGPETMGLFGANAAVGATLGFTGLAATIAGAIANAVAAAIVSALITKVAISALGEEVGRIVGVIASMIAINVMSSNGPFNLADSWAQMTKADNLIKLTMSGVGQYGNYLQGQAMEVNAQTQALMLEHDEAMKDINRLTAELFGNSGVDPTTITEAIRYATESPTQFLDRTTMTGTEIAELSIKLVEDFPAPQLRLPYLDQ